MTASQLSLRLTGAAAVAGLEQLCDVVAAGDVQPEAAARVVRGELAQVVQLVMYPPEVASAVNPLFLLREITDSVNEALTLMDPHAVRWG